MDGVDLACCDFFNKTEQWEFEILAAETIPYPAPLKESLKDACNWSNSDITALDIELATYYAGLLNTFHSTHRLKPKLIGSHGHTILHEPDRGITFQAGNGRTMAQITGITVVSDFRSGDVAQGGQGAPLVPVGDKLLFGAYASCLNLGGFANISYENSNARRIAYDLCPANMALNWIAALLGEEFDEGGAIAKSGRINPVLLQSLNDLEYYSAPPPKSLGREWFLTKFQPILEQAVVSISDLMATVVEHIALQVSKGINHAHIDSVLVTGGGVLNQILMERINYHSFANITAPEMLVIQYKEALVFAFLGLLRSLNEINCLASVTGGKCDLSAGMINNPK